MPLIVSRNGHRRAEIAESPGGVRIALCSGGASAPFFAARLDEMLTCSIGKPWRFEVGRLRQARLSSGAAAVLVQGDVGELGVELEFSFDEHDVLRLRATWTNCSDRALRDVAAGVLFPLPRRDGEIVTIPHMIYNNNPSSDPERIVPRLGVGPGQGFLCEEHRLPIPCVNVEWKEGGQGRYFSLYSIPDYVESGDGVVHYGSLGMIQEDERSVPAAMSGVLMFNGEKDVYYVGKSKTDNYEGGYLDFAPGFALTKRYALDWGDVSRPGHGFREIVRQGLKLFRPAGAKPFSTDEIIALKTAALDDRWRTDSRGAAGYVKFSDSNAFGNVSKRPLHYMYGWTGQGLKLAWCDLKLGLDAGCEERIERSRRAVDFYLRESAAGVPGLRHSAYYLEEGRWESFRRNGEQVVSSRALGETASDLADIALLMRAAGRDVPAGWTEAVREAADFFRGGTLKSGVYPAAWRLDGSPADEMITAAGIPCLIAAAKAYRLTGERLYLDHAETAMRRYYELHAETFERPFARSTLDARCEDKEAGMYFFQAASELYLLTQRERYLEWAGIAADWLLTYVYVWNPQYDRDSSFRQAGFQAACWPGVSVQNHHLDVFFPTYELWRFGQLAGSRAYERMGRMIFDAMGQGICSRPGEWGFTVIGEQGEGFYQTHYHQRGSSNRWNPSWVIALVLHNALRFREAGE